MARVAEFVERRELLANLTLRELRSRYKKSVLGWTWSLLNPLSSVIVYSIVFGVFLNVVPPVGDPSGLHSFVLFLLCGLLPWNFLSGAFNVGLESLVSNGNLIKKVYFPRELLVMATIGSLLTTLLVELGVLGVVMLIAGNMIIPWIPVVLVIVLIETVFALGFALVLSACNVYFRDVRHFMGILTQVLFYSAPIVYPTSLVPEEKVILGVTVPVLYIYRLNPIVRIIEAYRAALYDLRWPSAGTLAYLIAWAVGSLTFGLWVFGRLDRRIAEEV